MLLIFGVVDSHFYVLAGIQTQSDDLTSKIGAMSVVIEEVFLDRLNFRSLDFRPIGRLENRFVIFSVQ